MYTTVNHLASVAIHVLNLNKPLLHAAEEHASSSACSFKEFQLKTSLWVSHHRTAD